MDLLLHKLWLLITGTLVSISLLLLLLLPFQSAQTTYSRYSSSASLEDSPNILTSGMFTTLSGIEHITGSIERGVSRTLHSATKSVVSAATQTVRAVSSIVYYGVSFITDSTGSGARLVASSTESVLGLIADNAALSSVIRPVDVIEVPVIEPRPLELSYLKNHSVEGASGQAQTQSDSEAAWPIQGEVTTRFGVPHWPYQPTHSGVDISSGQRSGTTAVKPFKPGRVIETAPTRSGLGNHVVVDHGAGVTSVYGHLHSISVEVGQDVDLSTVLGYEGSTGVSTGTHLHFEIRVNGQPVNPDKFIRS